MIFTLMLLSMNITAQISKYTPIPPPNIDLHLLSYNKLNSKDFLNVGRSTLRMDLKADINQLSPDVKKLDLHLSSYQDRNNIGIYSLIGGIAFLTLGITTPGEYTSALQKKPIYKEPARLLAISTGSVLFIYGLITTISEK